MPNQDPSYVQIFVNFSVQTLTSTLQNFKLQNPKNRRFLHSGGGYPLKGRKNTLYQAIVSLSGRLKTGRTILLHKIFLEFIPRLESANF